MNESVLCVGHVNWDTVYHVDAIPEPDYSEDLQHISSGCGGSATNTALCLSSLGIQSTLVGSVGDDGTAANIEATLKDYDVTPELQRNANETARVFALISGEDDPRYFAKGTGITPFSSDDIHRRYWHPDALDHLHVTSFHKRTASEFAAKADKMGKTISFNPTQDWEVGEFFHVVNRADLIILNDNEAEAFREVYDFDKKLESSEIVVTHGGDGATYHVSPEERHPISAREVEHTRDTIGAGDTFTAGFLASWLDGAEPRDCLWGGTRCAAYAVKTVGAPDEIKPVVN